MNNFFIQEFKLCCLSSGIARVMGTSNLGFQISKANHVAFYIHSAPIVQKRRIVALSCAEWSADLQVGRCWPKGQRYAVARNLPATTQGRP